MLMKSLSFLIVPLFFFITSSNASGAALSINPSGNGVYVVQGSAMAGVAAIELTVTYNSASLSSPSVNKGSLISGALMVANTKNPGSIKIAIACTKNLSGSGPIVQISFANKGTGTVRISDSKLFDDKGAPSSQQSLIGLITTPETSTAATTSSSDTATTYTTPSSTSTAAASLPSSLGTVSMPGASQPRGDAKPAETSATEAAQQTPQVEETKAAATEPPVGDKPAADSEVKQSAYGSIRERFRTFQGNKTPATMMALFAKAVAPTIRQEPAIAISDGKTKVRIIADLPAFPGSSPNFALSGARMITLKRGGISGRWILEALPTKNVLNAAVTILNGNTVIEYPLTTVPSGVRISTEVSLFSDFLKNAGGKAPKRDLNGDGRHDYLDDYIYTGLYLIPKNSTNSLDKKNRLKISGGFSPI